MDFYLIAIGAVSIIVAAASGYLVGRYIDQEKLHFLVELEDKCTASLLRLEQKINESEYLMNSKILQLTKLHDSIEEKIKLIETIANEIYYEEEGFH